MFLLNGMIIVLPSEVFSVSKVSTELLGSKVYAFEDKPNAPLIVTNLSLSEDALLVSLADMPEPTKGCNLMVQYSINKNIVWLLIPMTYPIQYFASCTAVWGFYPHIPCRRDCHINAFLPNLVVAYHIGGCSWGQCVIIWHDIVTINCFHYCTLLSCNDPFQRPVVSLMYVIPWRCIHTSQPGPDAPFLYWLQKSHYQLVFLGVGVACSENTDSHWDITSSDWLQQWSPNWEQCRPAVDDQHQELFVIVMGGIHTQYTTGFTDI